MRLECWVGTQVPYLSEHNDHGFFALQAGAKEARMKQRAFGPLNFHATLDKCAAERSRKEIEDGFDASRVEASASDSRISRPSERRKPQGVFTEPYQPDLFRNINKEVPITRFHQLEYQPPLPHFRSPPPLFTLKSAITSL